METPSESSIALISWNPSEIQLSPTPTISTVSWEVAIIQAQALLHGTKDQSNFFPAQGMQVDQKFLKLFTEPLHQHGMLIRNMEETFAGFICPALVHHQQLLGLHHT